jgi:ketosteroid isomerase-like protein
MTHTSDKPASEDAVAPVRALYDAYEAKDRAAAERLIADDFKFFSPMDNGLDRRQYFEICWTHGTELENFKLTDAVQDGERVFVTYEVQTKKGERFCNAEVHSVKDGRISATEVYFGWDLPHQAKPGQHLDKITIPT